MEMEMRCAILTSNVKNSNTPDGSMVRLGVGGSSSSSFSSVPSGEFLIRRTLASSLCLASSSRNDLKAEGMLASTTESKSTMPISSSSERCDSLAASSSSVAMLNETEKERSEPSDPSAPAVALIHNYGIISSDDLRAVSKEAVVLRAVLAWQQGQVLSIRRLMTSSISPTKTPGRGGKIARSERRRVGGTHNHSHSGCVIGVLLGHAVEFARCKGHFQTSDVLSHLRRSLEPAAQDLASCSGEDAKHLSRGFASHHVMHAQLRLLWESKAAPRISSRYGKNSVAVGISACMYFLVSLSSTNARHATSLDMAAEFWVDTCLRQLDAWGWHEDFPPEEAVEAMEAERRALKRGVLGLRVAKREAKRLGLECRDAVSRLFLSYMRRAMWPSGKVLDREHQPELCEWIHSPEFIERGAMPPPPSGSYSYSHVNNVPLAALPHPLTLQQGGVGAWDSDSDGASVSESVSSSAGSLSSASSAEGSVAAGLDSADVMDRLVSFLGNVV